MRTFLAILILSVSAFGQGGMMPGPGTVHSVGAARTWTFTQVVEQDSSANSATCKTTTAAGCVVTVSAVGAGHFLFVFYLSSSNVAIGSVAGDSTWTHCGAGFAAFNAAVGALDCSYVLSATGGGTSITVKPSITGAGFCQVVVYEASYTGSTVAPETIPSSTSSASCTSCTAPALTITGTSDLIIQAASSDNGFTGIGGSYSIPGSLIADDGFATLLNTTSGTAPAWAQSPAGNAQMSAIAFK